MAYLEVVKGEVIVNSSEQTVDEAPWYRPDLPYWQRWLYWSIRNPLQNLRAFVLGVSDKNYSIIGRAPVMCVQRNDLLPPETGFQWCMLLKAHSSSIRSVRLCRSPVMNSSGPLSDLQVSAERRTRPR